MPVARAVMIGSGTGNGGLPAVVNGIGGNRNSTAEIPITYSMSSFASPTDSEFSEDASLFEEEEEEEEGEDAEVQSDHSLGTGSPEELELDAALDAMRNDDDTPQDPEDWRNPHVWTVDMVADWLESIGAQKYTAMFKSNNITGDVLIDLDKFALKEMGVKHIGDRLNLATNIQHLRVEEMRAAHTHVTDSIADLAFSHIQMQQDTPPPSGSPPPFRTTHEDSLLASLMEREIDPASVPITQYAVARSESAPVSPIHLEHMRPSRRSASPVKNTPQSGTFLDLPTDESTISVATTATPVSAGTIKSPPAIRTGTFTKAAATIADATPDVKFIQASNVRLDKQFVRVIFDSGVASVLSIEGAKTAEEVILRTLKKGKLNEAHIKSYCFYVLEGTDPNPTRCRRLGEQDLMRICNDVGRQEREKLIFRKIHAGEPDGEQLATAASLATQQLQQSGAAAASHSATRSQLKIQKLTGEPLPSLSYPVSPNSAAMRENYRREQEMQINRVPRKPLPPMIHDFHGGRPPSDLVVADVENYFPTANKAEIESIRRMSVRRSQRINRAASRISVVSNFSIASTNKELPPVPGIPAAWANKNATMARARPLSVFSVASIRDRRGSATSSLLGPLDEHDPRRSYVSSVAESPTIAVTDPAGKAVTNDDASSIAPTESGSSLNEQLRQAIAEDGEEPDEALEDFLKPDAFEDIKYVRGNTIGSGSFGTVYLALHAVTAELMAVKTVDLPVAPGAAAADSKRSNMVEALKREVALLRELSHPNIVRYLGSSSDENSLHILLEYVSGGSISKMLTEFGSFNETLVIKFVYQILDGLKYLHANNVIHRDIKGANILVDSLGKVKISDFGISKRVQDSRSYLASEGRVRPLPGASANRVSLQGSVFWMAPEVVQQTAYTRKADIWSLGCLVVEMMTGKRPHPDMSQIQAIFKIGGRGRSQARTGDADDDEEGTTWDPRPAIPESASEAAAEFLTMTFKIDYEARPEAEELMQTAFIKIGDGLVYNLAPGAWS